MKKRKQLLIVSASILLLLLTIPTHIKVTSTFLVQPYEISEIRNEADGFVRQVFVKENFPVKKGQVIATLENPQLNQDVAMVQLKLDLEQRQMALLQATYDPAAYQMKLQTRDQLAKEQNVLKDRVSKLILRSPIDGRVVTVGVDEKKGSYLEKGELFCKVANSDQVKLELPVQEHEIEDIQIGNTVKVKLDAFPAKTFRGVVKEIAPAGANYVASVQGKYARFRVLVVLQNLENTLLSGMQGDAKILGKKLPVLIRVGRELIRWFRSRVWY